jgi:uncharacterized membrane protein YidH (DUF202 family)
MRNELEVIEQTAVTDMTLYLALERTRMASERTLFALIRTGFAIAGGGVLVTKLLEQRSWPTWLPLLFSAMFVVIGFAFIYIGLHRYHQIFKKMRAHENINPIPSHLITILVVLLQITLLAVLLVYLL